MTTKLNIENELKLLAPIRDCLCTDVWRIVLEYGDISEALEALLFFSKVSIEEYIKSLEAKIFSLVPADLPLDQKIARIAEQMQNPALILAGYNPTNLLRRLTQGCQYFVGIDGKMSHRIDPLRVLWLNQNISLYRQDYFSSPALIKGERFVSDTETKFMLSEFCEDPAVYVIAREKPVHPLSSVLSLDVMGAIDQESLEKQLERMPHLQKLGFPIRSKLISSADFRLSFPLIRELEGWFTGDSSPIILRMYQTFKIATVVLHYFPETFLIQNVNGIFQTFPCVKTIKLYEHPLDEESEHNPKIVKAYQGLNPRIKIEVVKEIPHQQTP